jgi:hypothetical protein
METLLQTRETLVWFFKKLRARGRDRSYLKPIDDAVRKIDETVDAGGEGIDLNELNNSTIKIIEDTVVRENEEFPRPPDVVLPLEEASKTLTLTE